VLSDTQELQAWRARRPTRFRAARAYAIAARILFGYTVLRLRRPFMSAERYQARLVRQHLASSRRLTNAILELGGLFIKVGQLISILTNFLPSEFRSELEQLQDSVPARPLDEVRARIRKELGQTPEELFTDFDPNASDGYSWTNLSTTPDFIPDTIYVFGQSSNRAVTAADNVYGDNVMTTAVLVPEPSTYAIFMLGIALLGWVTRASRSRILS